MSNSEQKPELTLRVCSSGRRQKGDFVLPSFPNDQKLDDKVGVGCGGRVCLCVCVMGGGERGLTEQLSDLKFGIMILLLINWNY